LDEVSLAEGEGSYARALGKLAKHECSSSTIVESGSSPSQGHESLELLDDRYGQTSTLVTSQLPTSEW
jgi:hypothetical protein